VEHLPYLVTFARVVQAGSFVAGAERLKLSPSVASKHISKLEEHLGARLLNRSTRKLSLTEAGIAYYEHAARILEELDQSEHAVQRLQAEPSGRLKLSTLNSFANAVLAPLLPEFMRRHPKVLLEVVCNDRLVDLTEEGYDLALRITREPAPNVVARKLADIRFQVCGAPAYLERHGTPSQPADLARHRCLGYPASVTPSSAWRFLRDGEDLITALDVPAPLAALGATLDVETLAGPQPVEVPAGTQPGDVVLLRGQGMPVLRRPGRSGDLKVVINVVIPRKLSREQRELLERLAGTLTARNLGRDEGLTAKLRRLLH